MIRFSSIRLAASHVRVTTAALVLLAACNADSSSGANSGAADPAEDRILSPVTEDVFTTNSTDGEDWEQFGRISSAAFNARGELHILDAGAQQVLVLGTEGRLERILGGPGGGPGEFSSPLSMALFSDGTTAVFDFRLPPSFHVFGPDGVFETSVSVDMFKGMPGRSVVALPGRRVASDAGTLISVSARGQTNDDTDDAPPGRPINVFRLGSDSTEMSLLYNAWDLPPFEETAGETEMRTSEGQVAMRFNVLRAFEPGLSLAALSDGRLVVADSIGYRVKLIADDGRVVAAVERPIHPLPVTESMKTAERARRTETSGGVGSINISGPMEIRVPVEDQMRAAIEESVRNMVFAEELPVIDDIAVDAEDRIWIARTGLDGSEPGLTDIMTPEGEYIGTLASDGLRIPAAFGPNGLMAYIESDELDVQYIRVIRLVSLGN